MGCISNIIEDDLEVLENKLIAEENSSVTASNMSSVDIWRSINPIRLGSFSLWELQTINDEDIKNLDELNLGFKTLKS